MFHVFPPGLHITPNSKFPNTTPPPPLVNRIWKIFKDSILARKLVFFFFFTSKKYDGICGKYEVIYWGNMSIYWIWQPPYRLWDLKKFWAFDLYKWPGTRKNSELLPPYKLWDLKKFQALPRRVYALGLRKILSLTSYGLWDLEKFRSSPLYRVWDLEKFQRVPPHRLWNLRNFWASPHVLDLGLNKSVPAVRALSEARCELPYIVKMPWDLQKFWAHHPYKL